MNTDHRSGEFARARARAESDTTALRGRAARTVAGQAVDAEDRSRLLSMLGLDDEAGVVGPLPVAREAAPEGGTDNTVALAKGLAGYVRAVAAAVQVPAEATGFEVSDTATIYLGLTQRWVARPSRDLMLVWSEERGWLVAVETDPAEPPIVLDYLGGDDVVPDPHIVAWFVTDVIAGRVAGSRPPAFSADESSRDALAERLRRYANNA